LKVKATDNFSYYRLVTLDGLSVDDFRALQRGETVEITKELYNSNKYIFEVVKTSGKEVNTLKEANNGD